MFELINNLDKAVLLLVNGLNAPWLDTIMVVISKVNVWIPLYVSIVAFLGYRYGPRVFTLTLALALLAIIVDSTAAQIIKPVFERLRPCHEHDLIPFLNLPDGCGGEYGFVSNHAANTFAISGFLYLMLSFRHPKVKYIFFWAGLVSLSRVYLGKHYPLDIAFGGVYGLMWSVVVYKLYVECSIYFKSSPYFLRKWAV